MGFKDVKSMHCYFSSQECESAPCINGGSCQDAINAFDCACLSGYTGRFCEVDVDVCSESTLDSVLCYNGGVCVDGPGRTFYCRLVWILSYNTLKFVNISGQYWYCVHYVNWNGFGAQSSAQKYCYLKPFTA